MKPNTPLWQSFGPFQLCISERILLKEGKEVTVTPRTLDTLILLVQNAPNLVTSDQLMAEVWRGNEVEPANIAQQIYYVRKALNDTPQNRKYKYIENVSGSGYRFIAEVVEPQPTHFQAADHFFGRRWRWAVALAAMLIAVAVLFVRFSTPLDARVLKYTQITHDGQQKPGPLVAGGRWLAFQEVGVEDRVMLLPIAGGEATPLPGLSAGFMPTDFARDGKRLLLVNVEADGAHLWDYSLTTGKKRFVALADAGAWAPDGQTLVLCHDSSISFGRPGSAFESIRLPGTPRRPRWSPDGRAIRFSLESGARTTIWEVKMDDGSLHQLSRPSRISNVVLSGAWAADNKSFFYQIGPPPTQNIWVARDSGLFENLPSNVPVALTNGPGAWRSPASSKDSSSLFAVHEVARAELAFFDSVAQRWRPYWYGDSAYELDFSRDGQRVAYVRYPENILCTAKSDGSERVKISEDGVEVHQPHWSPDGKLIAFMGRQRDSSWRVYVVSARGGTAQPVTPYGVDQGVPTWSLDGRFLLFGDRSDTKPQRFMNIHKIELATQQITDVPDSHGMWSPRISPDGTHVLAISSDSKGLYMADWGGKNWKQLLRQWFVDNAMWSADSRYIYYNGRIDVYQSMNVSRLAITPGAVPEKLTDLKDFSWPPDNWFGVTPLGVVLALHEVSTEEIFALDYKLN